MLTRALPAALACLMTLSFPASAAAPQACDNGAKFAPWLAAFAAEAQAEGIPAATLREALAGVTYDPKVVGLDRGQAVFNQSFLQFSGRMVADYRLKMGRAKIAKYKAVFDQIEATTGVPPEVITGFWGLETDFGANMGKMETIRSVATLAYDCRRPDMFRDELKDLLRVIARGDLTAAQMRGPWAGELGQFQFLPSYYLNYAVDFDGDGRRDLLTSTPDALASAAALIQSFGWRTGEPWLEEVQVPAEMDWKEADLAITHPRSYWVKAGVRGVRVPLKGDAMPAALLLPMGRNGPAFVAYANFQVYLQWNQSLVYSTTAAYFATRIDGAPPVSPGRAPVTPLSGTEVMALQRALAARGHDVGKIDGKLGAATRAAVKAEQIRLGMPADSYPTPELLAALGGAP